MLMCMSIRMKEWGMMSKPNAGVRVPTDGLTGWGEAARRVGEGISATLVGGAHLMQERARVTAAGELADFSERLQAIDRETREELAEQDVQDWEYAWHAAADTKLAEALDELSYDSRSAGRELAQEFSKRAMVEARRDYELGKIDKARSQWRSRVDEAVQQGNSQRAAEWLQAGQGIFVPEQSMPAEQESVTSRAGLAYWQQHLTEDPLGALARLAATPQDELPGMSADARHLKRACMQARRSAGQAVMQHLLACVEDDSEPEPDYVRRAAEAGVISREQCESALREQKPLSQASRRSWMQRIDECPDDDDAVHALKLDIATAALPHHERRSLLKRVELSRTLPERERRCLSRNLMELYHAGAFGCPADDEAQQHLASLQQECLQRLAQDGSENTLRWLERQRSLSDCWISSSEHAHLI